MAGRVSVQQLSNLNIAISTYQVLQRRSSDSSYTLLLFILHLSYKIKEVTTIRTIMVAAAAAAVEVTTITTRRDQFHVLDQSPHCIQVEFDSATTRSMIFGIK